MPDSSVHITGNPRIHIAPGTRSNTALSTYNPVKSAMQLGYDGSVQPGYEQA